MQFRNKLKYADLFCWSWWPFLAVKNVRNLLWRSHRSRFISSVLVKSRSTSTTTPRQLRPAYQIRHWRSLRSRRLPSHTPVSKSVLVFLRLSFLIRLATITFYKQSGGSQRSNTNRVQTAAGNTKLLYCKSIYWQVISSGQSNLVNSSRARDKKTKHGHFG